MKVEESAVLVTGAAGFIGSHLTSRLVESGARVRAFVRYTSDGHLGNLKYLEPFPENLEIVFGDLRNPGAVSRAMKDTDMVFHLASVVSIPYSYINPREYFESNVFSILNILEAAKTLETSAIIHTSTSEVYGTAETVPMPETHPLKGQSPYSASKIGADMVAMSYFRSFESPVVTVRPFNTYGPRQSERAVIPTIILQALQGVAILLGDTRPTRDFNYVDDTVSGMIAAANKSEKIHGEVINLGTGVEVNIQDAANKILELVDSDARVIFNAAKVRPSKSEVRRLCADATKAKKLLKWEPKIPLEEGLRKTIEWYKENSLRLQGLDSYV